MYLQYWHPIILNINNNFLKFKMTSTYNWIRTKRQIKLIPYCLMSVGGFFHGNNLQGTKISQLKQNGFVRWLWAVKTYKYVIRQRSRNTVIRSNCWVSENDFIPYQLLYLCIFYFIDGYKKKLYLQYPEGLLLNHNKCRK